MELTNYYETYTHSNMLAINCQNIFQYSEWPNHALKKFDISTNTTSTIEQESQSEFLWFVFGQMLDSKREISIY